MTFEENNKAIYLQIADRICDNILRGKYDEDNRLPSVREFAAEVEVNVNTVMRSYEKLTTKDLIFNRRGIGFFVSPDAKKKIAEEKRQSLMKDQLPLLFRLMHSLGISPDSLRDEYLGYINNQNRKQ